MITSEFEEKQFEVALNAELLQGTVPSLVFSPGQVLEHAVGFDVALMTTAPTVWGILKQGVAAGLLIKPVWWGIKKKRLDPPTYKVNMFIQYKRPSYLKGTLANQWPYWKKPYFRYDIDEDQQKALEKCALGAGSSAVVLYACPNFLKMKTLYSHQMNGNLLSRTNLVEASKLSGHSCYTFVKGGLVGYANVDPTEVPSFNLEELRTRIDDSEVNGAAGVLESALKALRSAAEEADWYEVVLELATREANAISVALDSIGAPQNENRQRISQFIQIYRLAEALNLSWLVAGEEAEKR